MSLIISILIPNVIGFIGGLIGDSFSGLTGVNMPSFAPPSIVFPIVWTILYILMGISSYMIYRTQSMNSGKALVIYIVQLIVNALWSLFFFRFGWYLFSFIWILLLIFLVIIMIYKFYQINKTAAYLQIPYLLWLVFAAILSFNIYLLN